jgi:hypothetical protein
VNDDDERFKTPMALLLGRAVGNHWKASHDYIHDCPLSGGHRRDVATMTDNEQLKETEVTLNIRIWLNDKDLDRDTCQELFDLLKELNS